MSETQCKQCDKTSQDGRLHKCPICFHYFCEDHATVVSGRPFCSKGCANYFFFADPDD